MIIFSADKNTAVNSDLENIKDAFFGHNRENNKSLLQMIEELAEE